MSARHEALLTWLKTASDEQVKETGTSRGYLKQIAYGHKAASVELAVRIESVTDGAASRKTLRPDDWHLMWPELVDSSDSSNPKLTPAKPTETTA